MSKKNKRKHLRPAEILLILLLCLIVFLMAILANTLRPSSAYSESPEGYPIERELFLLDTFCELSIFSGGGDEAMDSAVSLLNYYDDLFNKSKANSDISKINASDEREVKINKDTALMLETAREICSETKGSLEPAIKPLTDLWDFKDKKEVPPEPDIKEALDEIKSQMWYIDGDKFVRTDPDVKIDVGAFAKGYIADKIKEDMLSYGVISAIINLGGNVLCIGSRPDGEAFKIAIRDPQKENGIGDEVLNVIDSSVVTSGIYERGFYEDGVYYHHILDPKTGYPVVNDLESVTVIGPRSVICDALSTAVFVMGREEGQDFIEEYNKNHGTGYELIFIRKEQA